MLDRFRGCAGAQRQCAGPCGQQRNPLQNVCHLMPLLKTVTTPSTQTAVAVRVRTNGPYPNGRSGLRQLDQGLTALRRGARIIDSAAWSMAMRRPPKYSTILRRFRAFGIAAVLMNFAPLTELQAAEHDSLLWFINNDDDGTSNAIRRLVEARASRPDATGTILIKTRVAEFYRARDFSPAWSGGERAEARGEAVMGVLQRVDEQGLHSSSYTAALKRWTGAPAGGKAAAAYDVALTTALFRYALDVRTGRTTPRSVYADVTLPVRKFNVADALVSAL